MKKIFAAALAVCMTISLAACGSSTQTAGTDTASTGSAVTGIDDLPGKTIGVQLGTTGDIYASDYEEEGSTIERFNKGNDAIQALLQGKPAANILLSGDAGTGKSSTVKAVANEFKDEGLRIIEVRKDQLIDIQRIIDDLNCNPLKFILFIDDLSFNQTDDNFSALKAILEGSVSAKSANVVIYATSNRRHIVKESFAERDNGDDVHRNDTVQELCPCQSVSDFLSPL